jgi:hypothetical protein
MSLLLVLPLLEEALNGSESIIVPYFEFGEHPFEATCLDGVGDNLHLLLSLPFLW